MMTPIISGEADKQALVDRLAAARNDLLAVVRDLPPKLLLVPVLDDAWSTKDIIGHIASWEDRLLTLAQMLINGEDDKIEWIGDEEALQAWNHSAYLRKRAWAWDEVIRELALIREELLWNLGWSTPDQLFASHVFGQDTLSPAGMVEEVIDHDVEHTAQLLAWLAKRQERGL